MFVHRHSDGKDQFDAVMAAVRASPELVALGKDGRGEERFTSRAMIETEQRLERADRDGSTRAAITASTTAIANARSRVPRRAALSLSAEQRGALRACHRARGAQHRHRLCRHRQERDAGRRARGVGSGGLQGARRRAVGHRRREPGKRLGHRVAHHRQPRASVGPGPRAADRQATSW